MVDTAWLRRKVGLDPKSIHDYVARGWLERVVRGVYRRPLPDDSWKATDADWELPLLSLQWIMGKEVHLGGESALDLAGYAHFLMLGGMRRVHVYGDAPPWLNRLPTAAKFVVHTRALFEDETAGVENGGQGSQLASFWRWRIKSSTPERAILEAIDELPRNASFSDLDKTFESLRTLRPSLLNELLNSCTSVKVRRLFFVFSDRHRHPWHERVPAKKINLGSGPRALVNGGKLHPTYRIYVPPEFAIPASTDSHYV